MENLATKNDSVLKAFIQDASNMKWIADINDNLVYANESFLTYFNLDTVTFPKNILEIFPRDIADLFRSTNQKVRNEKKPQNINIETHEKDGSTKSLIVHSFIINGTINPALVANEATEIIDKIKLPGKVEDNNRLIRFDRNSSEAMWEWNMLSGTMYRSSQLHALTGFIFDSSMDVSWWFSRIQIADRERVQHTVAAALEAKDPSWQEEYQFQCADGSYKTFRDRGFFVYDNKKPVKMFGLIQDITEIADLRNKLKMEKLRYQKDIAEAMIAAQERERTNLGNELHDNINQIITTVRLYVDMIQPATPHDQEIKSKTNDLIAMAYDEIRKLSKDLVSPQLKADSIIDGIQELIADIEASGKFRISFLHDQTLWVSRNLKIALFRIVQEQLKNVVRYSEASEVLIELRSEANDIVLAITDNGKGFDPKASRSGIGLNNISERVKLYDGKITIDSAPGAGCKMTVSIPL